MTPKGFVSFYQGLLKYWKNFYLNHFSCYAINILPVISGSVVEGYKYTICGYNESTDN